MEGGREGGKKGERGESEGLPSVSNTIVTIFLFFSILSPILSLFWRKLKLKKKKLFFLMYPGLVGMWFSNYGVHVTCDSRAPSSGAWVNLTRTCRLSSEKF